MLGIGCETHQQRVGYALKTVQTTLREPEDSLNGKHAMKELPSDYISQSSVKAGEGGNKSGDISSPRFWVIRPSDTLLASFRAR